MKTTIFLALLLSILTACHKDNLGSGPLKAVAKVQYNGSLEIMFDNVYSTGPIIKWQWSIDAVSATKDSLFQQSVKNDTHLWPFVANVHKPGIYTFRLSVFDKSSNVSTDTVTVIVN